MPLRCHSTAEESNSPPNCARGRTTCAGARGGVEGIYQTSLDARKPQNPINSEGYLWHLQGVLYIV
eukprot:8146658-Pyramimonas_sp.AAC.1